MQVGLNNINNSFGANWSSVLQPHFKNLKNAVYRTQNSQEIEVFQRNSKIIREKFKNGLIKLKTEKTDGVSKNVFYLEFTKDKKLDIMTVEKSQNLLNMGILRKIAHKLEKMSRG